MVSVINLIDELHSIPQTFQLMDVTRGCLDHIKKCIRVNGASQAELFEVPAGAKHYSF